MRFLPIPISRFSRQQFARAENAFDRMAGVSERDRTVVEAVSRFVAQGGTWQPSDRLRQDIEAAALGRQKCPRLNVVLD